MHIFFQNNQYLGSYYFTRSADDPVANIAYMSVRIQFNDVLICLIIVVKNCCVECCALTETPEEEKETDDSSHHHPFLLLSI